MASETALTFGVEVEFMLTINENHGSSKIYEAVADVFRRNLADPLPCACINRKWSKYRGEAYRYPDGQPLAQKDWKSYYCFSGDSSVVANPKQRAQLEAEEKIAVGLEVSTRALDFDKQGCPEFKAAVTAIRDGGSPLDVNIADELRPTPTQTAALHVHIGLRSRLDLDTAKKAAVLGWLLEPNLFSLCGPDRGMASHAPIRKESVLAKTKFDIAESNPPDDDSEDSVGDEKEATILESCHPINIPKKFSAIEKKWISTILGARDMDELAKLLSSAHTNLNARLALAIYNREDDHSTIEFRHFQSTMDYDLAWSWIRITAAIVQLASKPASEYNEKLDLIAGEYRAMRTRWIEHLRDRLFGRETTDPWLKSWQPMLVMLDLEDDLPFWHNYIAQLPERNRTT
ncbi:hypothetical protein F5Y13DRAFT_24500 [Hypoxylon sp. FL1857]|nr:hypothetical protein F5Y13DRAFT_24500 [Hypoxylon sp. FL1857]